MRYIEKSPTRAVIEFTDAEWVIKERFEQYLDDGHSIAVAAQRALTGHTKGVGPEFVGHLSMGTLRLDGDKLIEVSD